MARSGLYGNDQKMGFFFLIVAIIGTNFRRRGWCVLFFPPIDRRGISSLFIAGPVDSCHEREQDKAHFYQKARRKSGVYSDVNEHFEKNFNAVLFVCSN